MNMPDVTRSIRYQQMIDLADRYYDLVLFQKAEDKESAEIKDKLDRMEEEYSDNPAYVALLRAERKSR